IVPYTTLFRSRRPKTKQAGKRLRPREIRLRRTGSPTRRRIYTTFRTWPAMPLGGLNGLYTHYWLRKPIFLPVSVQLKFLSSIRSSNGGVGQQTTVLAKSANPGASGHSTKGVCHPKD